MVLRILIVDDEPAIHDVMNSYLKKYLDDYEILSAMTGIDALEQAQDCINQGQPPDFVLMDLKMPEMDGFECTERLSVLGIKNVYLLTGFFDKDSLKQAADAGAKGVLKKSEGFASIAQKVADMVRGIREPSSQIT